ncbi:MAG: hypothetical protein KKC76_19600 [Proteobacteria bacterium]|nr:hypothetical protein [Pseudomonadota bacterium]MBU4296924.1 hypothetical protein [Pseudomonadota bacterium]MCG2746088.1 hypothetical protein [Desulfobulbaceae bacterium]
MFKPQKRTMMYWTMALVFFVFIPGTFLHAEEDRQQKDGKKDIAQVQQEADDTLQAIKDYSIDKKDQVMAQAKDVLDKMDVKIDELEKQSSEKWQDMSEASREKSRQALRELRKKRNDIAEWYGGMKHSSAAAWDEMKKGFIESYHLLQKAFDKAAEKF